jgi:hypothetical protein
MKRTSLALIAALSVPAQAQVRVEIDVPRLVFPAPPQLVVVEPGIQVVRDADDEVFFVDNYYWHRRNGRWFRTRTHTGGWVAVEERYVPGRVAHYAPGQYRHWRGEVRHEAPREVRHEAPREVRHEAPREVRHEESREERHEAPRERKEEKHEPHGEKHH